VPRESRLQIVSPCAEPPEGDGWLHEIKHDGHRLLAVVAGSRSLQLISRNGYDRTPLFREPFRTLTEAGLPAMVLDGEIAVPDERGVTHLDALNEAISARQPERLAYFAFDLLHFAGHDLRRCPIEERKLLLRTVLDEARCERIVYVDHVVGIGRELFQGVRQVGGEGIVSKRRGSTYRGGENQEWLKSKCFQLGVFAITGFRELGQGRLEAIYVAEERGGMPRPAGRVQFGFPGKGLWPALDRIRAGPARKGVVPVRPGLMTEIKYFGRLGGWIRDGVVLSVAVASRHRLLHRGDAAIDLAAD